MINGEVYGDWTLAELWAGEDKAMLLSAQDGEVGGELVEDLWLNRIYDAVTEPLTASSAPATIEREIEETWPETAREREWLVTVFDNPLNTYEEVMTILMIATGCDVDEAYMETWEIDHLGKSVVHCDDESECRRAAEIISTIGIRVEVSKED